MEAAETLKPAPKPDFSFNDDPAWFLESVNYLDPDDPIDQLLATYKEDIEGEALPTAARQRVLIAGLQTGELDSARALIDEHQGLIAAVAYPFKAGERSPSDLLCAGRHGLIQAAKSYDKESSVDFSDHAAFTIHNALSSVSPNLSGDSFIELPQHPMEGVYQFMETVQPAASSEEIKQTKTREDEHRERKSMTHDELMVLPVLHLTEKGAASALGDNSQAGPRIVRDLVASIKKRLGAETKEEAALKAYKWGMVEYDILDIPEREHFTLDERRIATRLGRGNKAIYEELGISENKFNKTRASLSAKTKARSRAELLIMAHVHNFEPTQEELHVTEPSLFESLAPLHKEVIRRGLYQQDEEISSDPEIPLSPTQVTNVFKMAIKKVSSDLPANTRSALVLELHEQGMELNVNQPPGPLSEILYAHELEVARLAHLPYAGINEELGQDFTTSKRGDEIRQIKNKIGARSRLEIALMVRIYDDESEALEQTPDNRWRLAKLLGVKTLEACDIEALLSVTLEREREAITAYYLGSSVVTWSEAGERLGVSEASANSAASRGVHRMVDQLETT